MFRTIFAILFAVTLAVTASAQNFYAATERLGADGTIARYATMADALAEVNPIFSGLMEQRDQSVFVTSGVPMIYHDAFYQLTAWYFNGGNNPNNTNASFNQLADDDASTVVNWNGAYDLGLSNFTVNVSGINADYPNDSSRLDNAGNPPGAGEVTIGHWHQYSMNLVATGLNAVSNGDGTYTNTTNASGYSGTYYGLFENLSVTDPGSNGFYVLRLNYNNTSWGVTNSYALDDEFTGTAVPEPATMAVLGLGAAFLARRRQRR